MDLLIARLGLALAIGLLVGLERGWRERDDPEGSRTAGIRTFGISGLLGGLFASLAESFDQPLIFAAGFSLYALVFAWFKSHEAEHDDEFSVTSVIAGFCVFALGGMAVSGDFRAAAAGGAALAAVLASREVLHGLLRRLTWPELRSALILAAMTAIVLPLLPNRTIDPWGGLNPWEVWFFTVLIASISFLGYIAVRVLGPTRGLLVSGLAGALVSSTAVTIALGREASQGGNSWHFAGAASLAAMVSIVRVLMIVLALQPLLVSGIVVPVLAGAAVFAICGALFFSKDGQTSSHVANSRNPFDLLSLMIFGSLFATVSTISAAMVASLGSQSLVASAVVSGTLDVDIAVLSSVRFLNQGVAASTVGLAVVGALSANAVGRLMMAMISGPVRYWLPLALATAAALAAAGTSWSLQLA
jgi:uncharacterized membrane protein (DUF4010 family)